MNKRRIKITYPENTPPEDIQLAVESNFGGFGTVYRGENERVLYLLQFRVPYDLVKAQLAQLQNDGYLAWEESP
jgi:hypothetical protein